MPDYVRPDAATRPDLLPLFVEPPVIEEDEDAAEQGPS